VKVGSGTVPEERIRYIDGCRALAVLGVLLDHCLIHAAWAQRLVNQAPATNPILWSVTLLSKGAHGVDLFFVISGFCLSYPTLERYYRDGAVSFRLDRFIAKRLVRILPPYYAALFLCLIAYSCFRILHAAIPTAMNANVSVWDVVRQLLMLDRGTRLTNDAFWTLFVEFRWYFLFPFLLVLWLHSKRAYGVLLIGIIVAYHYTRARSLDLGVLPAFMLGIVAADWHIIEHPLRKYSPILAAIAFDAALLIEPHASVPGVNGLEDYGFYTQANIGWHLTCFFFVVAAGAWGPLRGALSVPALVFIGEVSYSIYLIHQPIVSYIDEQMIGRLGKICAFMAGVITSLVAGIMFWRLIERPFYRGHALHDRLVKRIEKGLGICLWRVGIPERITMGCIESARAASGNGPLLPP
jgi:peptidoglycan/LPS O-acetylase OafA/YrhL